jgi:hypothetical protein
MQVLNSGSSLEREGDFRSDAAFLPRPFHYVAAPCVPLRIAALPRFTNVPECAPELGYGR